MRAMEREIDELYADRPGSIRDIGASPAEMRAPDGGFVLVRADGEPIGGGGFKRLDEHTCEIKRMYLVPRVRGRGLARPLLAALEDCARERGYVRARLDTADRQPAAKRLYEGAGYRPIPDYNANPLATFWFEKELR